MMQHTWLDVLSLAPPPAPTKVARLLHLLAGGDSINRFEAVKVLHDHTLNSTISELSNDWEVRIARKQERVPDYKGKPVGCVRYSIEFTDANAHRCYMALIRLGFTAQGETYSLFDH